MTVATVAWQWWQQRGGSGSAAAEAAVARQLRGASSATEAVAVAAWRQRSISGKLPIFLLIFANPLLGSSSLVVHS